MEISYSNCKDKLKPELQNVFDLNDATSMVLTVLADWKNNPLDADLLNYYLEFMI